MAVRWFGRLPLGFRAIASGAGIGADMGFDAVNGWLALVLDPARVDWIRKPIRRRR